MFDGRFRSGVDRASVRWDGAAADRPVPRPPDRPRAAAGRPRRRAIGSGRLFWGLVLLIAAAVPDLLDGALAKASGTAVGAGRLLRLGRRPGHRRPRPRRRRLVPAEQHHGHAALLPFAVLGVSMLISYERAKAESLGFKAKGGLMERAERIIVLCAGLAFSFLLIPLLWLMLVLTAITAVQRFVKVWRQASAAGRPSRSTSRSPWPSAGGRGGRPTGLAPAARSATASPRPRPSGRVRWQERRQPRSRPADSAEGGAETPGPAAVSTTAGPDVFPPARRARPPTMHRRSTRLLASERLAGVEVRPSGSSPTRPAPGPPSCCLPGVVQSIAGTAGSAASPGPGMASQRAMVARHQRRVYGPELDGRALGATGRSGLRVLRAVLGGVAAAARPSFAEIDAGMSWEGVVHIEEAIAAGRGCILALPHLGGWEWAGVWLIQLGFPTDRGGRGAGAAGAVRVVRSLPAPPRDGGGHRSGRAPGRAVLRALKANHVVCLLCDRNIGGSAGVEVEFFGERTLLPAGPVTLALRTGASLLPTAVYFCRTARAPTTPSCARRCRPTARAPCATTCPASPSRWPASSRS